MGGGIVEESSKNVQVMESEEWKVTSSELGFSVDTKSSTDVKKESPIQEEESSKNVQVMESEEWKVSSSELGFSVDTKSSTDFQKSKVSHDEKVKESVVTRSFSAKKR